MRLKSLKKNKKGFTLVELIVVLAIIAIMVAVAAPSFIGYVKKAETQMKALEDRNTDLEARLDKVLGDLPSPAPSIAP